MLVSLRRLSFACLSAATLALTTIPVAAEAASTGALPANSAADNSNRVYTLDGYGGIHAAGSAPALSSPDYFLGNDIARGLALNADGTTGYVLDGKGGLHPVGGAARITNEAYFGWDIARGIQLAPWSTASSPAGWVIDGWGGIHAFGGAPAITAPGAWVGWDIVRGFVVSPDSTPGAVRGYVVDGKGGLHPFGGLPVLSGDYFSFDIVRGAAFWYGSTAASPGLWLMDGWGGLHAYGSAPVVKATLYQAGVDQFRSIIGWTAGAGGWVLLSNGSLAPFGSAPNLASNASFNFDIARSAAGGGSSSSAGYKPPPPPPPPAAQPTNPRDIIWQVFESFGGDSAAQWGERVAACESGYNPQAYNPAGPYYGLFQFLRSTFDSTPYGGGDIFDPWANARAAAWKYVNYGGGSWGCN